MVCNDKQALEAGDHSVRILSAALLQWYGRTLYMIKLVFWTVDRVSWQLPAVEPRFTIVRCCFLSSNGRKALVTRNGPMTFTVRTWL